MTDPLLDEVSELGRLYRAQAARVERMLELEERTGAINGALYREIEAAAKLASASLQAKVALGVAAPPVRAAREEESFARFSEKTRAVFQNPESRHRVLSLLEQFKAMAQPVAPELTALPGGRAPDR